MKKTYSILLLLLFSGSSLAGQGGNGGDVVVCESADGSKTYELLDIYETREKHFLKLDFNISSKTPEETALYQVGKFDEYSKYYDIENKIESFMSRVVFVNEVLEDIPDSYETYIPNNCSLEQIAINYQDGRIVVNQFLWNSLDINNRGALILHEIFYEDFLASGFSNSIAARQLNSYLHGNHVDIYSTDRRHDSGSFIDTFVTMYVPKVEKDKLLDRYLETPFIALKVRDFDRLLNRYTPTEIVEEIADHAVGILKKREDKFFEGEILASILRDIEDITSRTPLGTEREKLLERFLQKLRPIQIFMINKTEDIINYSESLSSQIFYYERTSNREAGYLGAEFLSRYKYFRSSEAIKMGELFLKFNQRCVGYGCEKLNEELFFKIDSGNYIVSEVYEAILILLNRKHSRISYRFKNFLNRIAKIKEMRADVVRTLLSIVTDPENLDINSIYDLKGVLWQNKLRQREVIDLLETRITYPEQFQGILNFVYESDYNGVLFDLFGSRLEFGFAQRIASENEYSLRNFIHFYSKVKRTPSLETLGLIHKAFRENRIRRRGDELVNFYKFLTSRLVMTNELVDFLGYVLRYKNHYYPFLGVHELVKAVPRYTDYLYSVINQEIKVHFAARDRRETINCLKLLQGRELPTTTVTLLQEIEKESSSSEIKKLARELLDLRSSSVL